MQLRCPYCGFSKEVPGEKIPRGARWANCPQCGQRFEFTESQAPPWVQTDNAAARGEDAERPGEPPPGPEESGDVGFWGRFLPSVRRVHTGPGAFFAGMDCSRGLREPLAFGVLCGAAGSMLSLFWQFLALTGSSSLLEPGLLERIPLGPLFFALLLSMPFFILIGLFVSSALLHLCLMLAGAGSAGYEGTFRVLCYSQATRLWSAVPLLGGWIGWLWRMIIQMIGLRAVHRTTYLRLFLAFLLPLGAFLLLVGVTLTLLFIFFLRPLLGGL